MRTEAQAIDLAAGTHSHSNDPRVETPGRVSEVAVPPDARALSTVSRIDYEDAHLLETGPGQDRTGEEWARVILEDAPATTRRALRLGWFALGLRLGSTRDDPLVLGWRLRRCSPDAVLLAASSRLGLAAEVLCKRERDTLLVATFLQLKIAIARAVWAAVAPGHRRVMRYLLEQAGGRIVRRSETDER